MLKHRKDRKFDPSREGLAYDPLPIVFKQLCLVRPSPVTLYLKDLFDSGRLLELVQFRLDPKDYVDLTVDQFFFDYACASFFKKFQDFNLGIDKEELAFAKWLEAEEKCRLTNRKFQDYWSGDLSVFSTFEHQVLYLAQRKISSILGSIDYEFIRDNCRFGPGSDLSTEGGSTSLYDKFATTGSSTPWVLPISDVVFSEDIRQDFVHEALLLHGNRLSFVRKTALVDRSICVEPRWNIYLQLGVGALIQFRLLKVGIDITDQSRNQKLASRAYHDGHATIDLSSASDTICKNLVLDLLPEDWSDLIFRLRSPTSTYRGESYPQEKVSSMGNGYTFPLETLIFFAISSAVVEGMGIEGEVSVYGDDIIVPKACFSKCIETLEAFGFLANHQKSFGSGEFFESCGHDYFRGVNVRPIFVKKSVSNVISATQLCNQISELASRSRTWQGTKDVRLLPLWRSALNSIPKEFRLFGPIEGGSGCVHTSFDKCTPQRAKFGLEGWFIDAYVFKSFKTWGGSFDGHLYSKLSSDIDSQENVSRRDQGVWRRKRVMVSSWSETSWA